MLLEKIKLHTENRALLTVVLSLTYPVFGVHVLSEFCQLLVGWEALLLLLLPLLLFLHLPLFWSLLQSLLSFLHCC